MYIVIQKYNLNCKPCFFKVCKYRGVFKNRMLEAKKKQRDATNLTLYGMVLLIVSSVMTIFPHSISPPESRPPHFSKSVRMRHILSLVSKCSQLFQLQIQSCPCFQHLLIIFNFQKHRSKCTKMHLLVSLVSKLFQQCQLWFIGQVMSKHIVICEHSL